LTPYKDITDPRLVKALAHPLRVRILSILDQRVASPSELAQEIGAPLGNVSYHVRILASLGLARLVKETPRRGSVEHHYTAVARPHITNEAWAAVPDIVKRAMVGATLQQAGAYVNAAAQEGGFDRAEAHISRTPVRVDKEGWELLSKEIDVFLAKVAEIEEGSAARAAEGGEATEDAVLLMMLFESAPQLAQPQHRVREHIEAGGHEHPAPAAPAAQPHGASLPA
jgi:DNA-binding transcriptional ArsR family regulator